MNLKKLLKTIKLNESTISIVLGAIVLVIVGTLVIKYLKNSRGTVPADSNNNIQSESLTYKVEKGDNLWKIAEKYYNDGYKWTDIATENKLENASDIVEGQELIIPNTNKTSEVVEASPEAAQTAPTEIAKPAESGNAIASATYEVIKGDNLWDIAVRAYGDGYKWVEIARENKLVNPNLIHPGNVLVLPR